jgi:glutathione S-transferase
MALRLIIGNKNYSSWSFRPWLAMKVAGIAFEETLLPLDAADFKSKLATLGGAGKVPLLIDGEIRVWESLAILEYLAERFPAAGLWPREAAARPVIRRPLDAGALVDAARIQSIWTESRDRFGVGGPFLYGAFGAADAMYAPVVSRFHTYAVEVGPAARAYMAAMMGLPAWTEWRDAARRETSVLPHDEVDWPEVKRE